MAEAIVSYPGAKWRFYPHMVQYFPVDMKTYIEPFLGGGSVALSISDDTRFDKLERMILGDLYSEMWAFWTGVKNNPNDVHKIAVDWFTKNCPHQIEFKDQGIDAAGGRELEDNISKIDTDEKLSDEYKKQAHFNLELYHVVKSEAEKFWKWCEDVDCTTLSIPERAARMYLVNKMSFSAMGDSGSLSMDRFCAFRLENANRIEETSKLLTRAEIYNVSFEDTMKYGNDDPDNSFIFLDPPYFDQEKSGLYGRNGNMHHGFPHLKFAEYTKSMKCKWFVTYDDSVAVRKLFSGKDAYGKEIQLIPFTIPGGYTMAQKNAEDALAGEELFIMNYNNSDNELDFDF